MWMIRPAIQREITIDLPDILVESLGVGAEMLAQHLNSLAEAGANDPQNHPPPLPVLCRICERQITPWWFPKHTELCLQEHRAEAEVESAQERLVEHRTQIVKVLDALEAQAKQKNLTVDGNTQSPNPEYKGVSIGPSSASGSGSCSSSGSVSRSSSLSGREGPAGQRHHKRMRSFTVRRPLARIVELVLDLCDTASEISTPVLKDTRNIETGEFRTQSPQSEGRINEVTNWQSPSASTLENEAGLALLCDDTTSLSRAKVDAVQKFRHILEFSERIRNEFTALVQECIDAALQQASRIAAGESSGSSDDSSSGEGAEEDDDDDDEKHDLPQSDEMESNGLGERSSSIVSALRENASTRSISRSPPRKSSPSLSERSGSQKGPPTPRSRTSGVFLTNRSSMCLETDTGGESDNSVQSQTRTQLRKVDSPASEAAISRTTSSRERKRKSLILPRAMSTSRVTSPANPSNAPSPLIVHKSRCPSGGPESARSPLMSPTLSSAEYCSPPLGPQQQPQHRHRRQSSNASSEVSRPAVSPHLTTNNPQPRATAPSIKDFEIIKPISKGAFGSVYLAKKKSTGDYYAIKALKKADMVAKNQVANVKAERAILMWQGESDFVAKLYWTFPSKDYIFLVMEYLNGGDCASLVKTLGALPEDWAKRYMAEVVLGVEHLHARGIVHRDLKPDNFLIDQKGHLKLTDFGLSRMGLIGRQKRALSKPDQLVPDPLKQGPFARSSSMASSRSASFDVPSSTSPASTPAMTPVLGELSQPSYFSLGRDTSRQNSGSHSDSVDLDHLAINLRRISIQDEVMTPHSQHSHEDTQAEREAQDTSGLRPTTSESNKRSSAHLSRPSSMLPPPMALFDPDDSNRRFVGTPDYLAPETINGLGQDETSDWWSLGCILFEFLFGYPPFHGETPDQVFENILARRIDWPQDDSEASAEAKDLMSRLMSLDPGQRLGSNTDEKFGNGGEEIRSHPWFGDVEWDMVNEAEPSFVPAPSHPEDTEYFDTRGASTQDFSSEFEDQKTSPIVTPGADYPDRPHDALSKVRNQVNNTSTKRGLMPLHIPKHVRDGGRSRRLSEPVAVDDFGQFSFKNLPVLEKANKDVIQKLRAEAMQAQSRHIPPPKSSGGSSGSPPTLEGSPVLNAPLKRTSSSHNRSASPAVQAAANPSPNRNSQPASPLVQFSAGHNHERRKTSSGSSYASGGSLQPGSFFELPKLPPSIQTSSTTSSPIKTTRLPFSSEKDSNLTSSPTGSPRTRSHTVGSNESEAPRERISRHQKHRSQVLETSPTSSDNDDARQKALLRVHRRRQSSRRLSRISLNEGPMFRPLDVLVCEDHPVSRLVMEKLLRKLRCRAIVVSDGSEAMRYAMSTVKFDIIMTEYKLPQVNGSDMARMIRETKNANNHTPIVAVTGYLKELPAPHCFDSLIEKPPTTLKLTEVLTRLCQWKAPPPGWVPPPMALNPSSVPPSALRNESAHAEDSPTSSSSGYTAAFSSSFKGSSREDSMSSTSVFTEPDAKPEETAITITRPIEDAPGSRKPSGLGISETLDDEPRLQGIAHAMAALTHQDSAPAGLESIEVRKKPSAELIEAKRRARLQEHQGGGDLGDDEDDELGNVRARSRSPLGKYTPVSSSKLSAEMMRTDSQSSVISVIESPSTPAKSGNPDRERDMNESPESRGHLSATTPPVRFSPRLGDTSKEIDMDATPTPQTNPSFSPFEDDFTPKPQPPRNVVSEASDSSPPIGREPRQN